MVYKKYIKKGGKVFGPYYCESYRDKDGKVRTRYVEASKSFSKRWLFVVLAIGLLVAGLGFFVFQGSLNEEKGVSFSGKVISNIGFSLYGSVSNSFHRLIGFSTSGSDSFVGDSSGSGGAGDSPVVQEPVKEPVQEPAIDKNTIPEPITNPDEVADTSPIISDNPISEPALNESIVEPIVNETIPVVNESIVEPIVNETIPVVNESIVEPIVNETTTEFNVTVNNARIVLGRPVKWVKTIQIDFNSNLEDIIIDLPKEAENISVKTGSEVQTSLDELQEYNGLVENADRKDIVHGVITGLVGLDTGKNKGLFSGLWNWFIGFFRVSGRVIDESQLSSNIIENSDSKDINLTDIVESGSLNEVSVEYYTEAPVANEIDISGGKRVTVSGPDNSGYENILAYSSLDNSVSLNDKAKIRMYHLVESVREEVSFDAYDLNDDGLVDYVEWNVPHLSEQVYEIIYITKAIHLDSNRNFIEDVYDYVKAQDNNWTTISNGDYVRVTFEIPLDKTRDITIYSRGNNSQINVYAENSSNLIASFENISSEQLYKVYLSNLSDNETYSTFDLKSIGNIEYDYIVDPFVDNSSLVQTVYDCGNLTTANAVYTLNQSLNTTETCFNINANNITLNGNGFTIDSDDNGFDYGVRAQGRLNVTIKNFLNITDFYGGVYFLGTNQSLISNLTAKSNSEGVYLSSSSNNTIRLINANDNSYGVHILSSSNNVLTSITTSNNQIGVRVFANSNNNNLTNITSNNNSEGIWLFGPSDTSLNLIAMDNNSQNGLYLWASTNIIVQNGIITNSGQNDTLVQYNSPNDTFINVTYNLDKESVMPGGAANSQLIRKWYYQVYVNDSDGNAVANANITVLNSSGGVEFSGLMTNASGWTNITTITDYINNATSNGGTRNYYSPYNVSIVSPFYSQRSFTYNSTSSLNNLSVVYTMGVSTNIASCRNITSPGTYTLNQSLVTTTGDCLIVQANNVTIDMNGKNISGRALSTGKGIFVSNSNYTTIKNGLISDFIYAQMSGIQINNSIGNNITNMILLNSDIGLYLYNCNNSFLTNIIANGSYDNWWGTGILALGSGNNIFNNITASGNAYDGLGFGFNSMNNTVINSTTNYNTGKGTYSVGRNNSFINLNSHFNNYGVYISASPFNSFQDSNLSGNSNDVYVNSGLENSFLNCSFYSEYSGGLFYRRWYYQAYVNDSFGNSISNANLTFMDINGNYNFNLTTNASGWTNVKNILEYAYVVGYRSYSSPYSISVVANSSYATKTINYNVSANQNNLNHAITIGSALSLTDCGDLDSPGATYTLQNDVISQGTCFNIYADGITLDGNGKNITYSTLSGGGGPPPEAGYGVFVNGYNNVTIKNARIYEAEYSMPSKYAIYLSGSNYSIIYNNTIVTGAPGSHGANILTSNYFNLTSNNITTGYARGIRMGVSHYGNVFSNVILTTDTLNPGGAEGIYLSSSNYSNIISNNVSTLGSSDYGIQLTSGSNFILVSGNIISSTNAVRVYSSGSSNNFYKDTTLIGTILDDIQLTLTSTNNTFLNVTYNSSNEYVASGSQLIRQWYYRAFVNDNLGNRVSNANVTAFNVSGNYQFNMTTNSTGWTNITTITDYINNGAASGVNITYYSPYNISAVNSSYSTKQVASYNVTLNQNNLNHTITMMDYQNISSCGTLGISNAVYTLMNNLNTTSTCFNITANNVTIDFNGKNMTGDMIGTDYGVYVKGQNFTTIKNGFIYYFNFSGIYLQSNTANNITNMTTIYNYYDIYLTSSNNNSITRNNITNGSFTGNGLHLITSHSNLIDNNFGTNNRNGIILNTNSKYNTISNNTMVNNQLNGVAINTGSSNNYIINNNASENWGPAANNGAGILITASSLNNIIINNTAHKNKNQGISIQVSSNNNTVINNTFNSNQIGMGFSTSNNNLLMDNNLWNCTGSGGGTSQIGCIFLSGSDNNRFIRGVDNLSASNNLYFVAGADNNSFKDMIFTGETGSVITCYDDSQFYAGSQNNTLTNVTYNGSEALDISCSLTRKWYYQAYVNDSTGAAVAGANLTANNMTGRYNFNLTTNSSGVTQIGEIIDYVNYGGTKTYYSPYNISVVSSQHNLKLFTYNSTSSLNNLSVVYTMGVSTNLTTCGALDKANAVYTLQNDVVGGFGICFNISANNVTIDMNGKSASGTQSSNTGINVWGYNSTTIKNGLISNFFSGQTSSGISISSGINHNITNMTLVSDGMGIYLSNCNNSFFTNIIVNDSQVTDTGIWLWGSSNNLFSNILSSFNPSNGIWIYGNSTNNNVINSTFNNNGVSGVILEDSLVGNNLTSITANNNKYGVYFASSSNNNLRDWVISNSSVNDTVVLGVSFVSVNNTFINVTYNLSKEYVQFGSQLIRKWYYQSLVNNGLGQGIPGVNVTLFNRTGDYQFNATTNSSGLIDRIEIIDYINNGGTITYYSPYNISAVNNSFVTNISSYNVSANVNNLNHSIKMSLSSSPVFCGILDQANTNYTLQNNVATTGTCFDFRASNVLLNMNGKSASGDSGSGDYGLYSNSYDNVSVINGNISGFGRGVYFANNNGNNITNLLSRGNDYGVYLDSSLNNIFRDGNFSNNNVWNVYLTSNSQNNTFTNVSYDFLKESIGTDSELIRKWYYQAYSNTTYGDVMANVNVSAFNLSNSYMFNLTTNASGWTPVGEIIDYINLGGVRNMYSLYKIYAINSSYPNNSSYPDLTVSYNVTLNANNLNHALTFDNSTPNVNLLSPLTGASYTTNPATISFVYNVSDYSDIVNCSVYLSDVISESFSSIVKGSNNLIQIQLGDGSYNAYVGCRDIANNFGNSSSISFSVSGSISANNVNPSGGGGVSEGKKTPQTIEPSVNLSTGASYTSKVKLYDRIRVEVENESHYVELIEIKPGQVTLVVTSSPQRAILNIGEEKRFEVTGDEYNDIFVKLNDIGGDEADLTIRVIKEEIVTELNPTKSSQPVNTNNQLLMGIFILVLIIIIEVVVIIYVITKWRKDKVLGKN